MSTFRTSVLGLAAGAAALAFAGPALALDEVTFGTNWVAEAEHGGFYQAVADGTYEKYGLKVTIIPKAEQGDAARRKDPVLHAGQPARHLLGVEQDMPVIEVAAMFQKDPQIFMAHPEAGREDVRRPRQAPSRSSSATTCFVTGFQWMKAAYPGFKDEQRKPYTYNLAPFLADKMSPANRATSPPSPTRSRRRAASSPTSS